MQAVLSTVSVKRIAKALEKCESIEAVQAYLMNLDYFCFFKTEKRNKFKTLFDELAIYRQVFAEPLHIAVMHNQFVYENKGLSKLNHWQYFRNIEEIASETTERLPVIPEEERLLREPILLGVLKTFMDNNFNESNYKEITVRRKIGSERSVYGQ